MTALIGYGSHGRDIETIWKRCQGTRILHTYENDQAASLAGYASRQPTFFGVNNPRHRKEMGRRNVHSLAPALIDPSALVGPNCTLGGSVVVGPHSVLLTEVHLGQHVHVNYGAMMTRTKVGAFSTICPGVTICGDVTIGEACLIGAGAVICDRSTLGDCVVIAAGAIVPPLSVIPDDATVIGVWKP